MGSASSDLIKTVVNTVHKLSEDVSVRKNNSASFKSQINKLHDKVCQPSGSVSRQTMESLTDLERPHIGIQSGSMRSCSFWIYVYLLIEELLCTLHQLLLRLGFLLSKTSLMVSKLSPTERRQPPVITLNYRRQPLIGLSISVSLPIISQKESSRLFSFPDLVLKSLLTMLRSF
jgi:hypothetical protein